MNKPRQYGFGLLDALIGVGVLAAGLLILTAAINRNQSNARELQQTQIAASLLQDFSARLHLNQAISETAVAPLYIRGFDDVLPAQVNCSGSEACDAATLAQYNLATWGEAVSRQLPSGRFAIASSSDHNPTLLAIMLAWQGTGVANRASINSGLPDLICPETFSCLLLHAMP